MHKAQETVLEIDLEALKHNFQYIKSLLKKDTKILAVVKAFAYGSEVNEVANFLQDLEVDYFAVAYVKEGVALRDAGIKTPILVLHPQPVNFQLLIERCLEPNLYSFKILKEFIESSKALNQKNYPVHIKFNTGLNRLGFREDDIEVLVSELNNTTSVKVKSLFSHLAASEDLAEDSFTKGQIAMFSNISEALTKHIGNRPIQHICNTSGVLNYTNAQFDMVRCGIGIYGYGNSKTQDKHFKPVATLKSVISQIHQVEKDETVGYNRAFKSDEPIRTATIPIGHADGIGRIYGSGKGIVSINGKPAPIVGNVCMDMIMVNVTDIDCKEGDEVIIFGKETTAADFAKGANTISYEILTAISQRVKRQIIR
ncbi:MAG: alanine racemase [Bacteroidota bacterium]